VGVFAQVCYEVGTQASILQHSKAAVRLELLAVLRVLVQEPCPCCVDPVQVVINAKPLLLKPNAVHADHPILPDPQTKVGSQRCRVCDKGLAEHPMAL
jgi:hypothetical protein